MSQRSDPTNNPRLMPKGARKLSLLLEVVTFFKLTWSMSTMKSRPFILAGLYSLNAAAILALNQGSMSQSGAPLQANRSLAQNGDPQVAFLSAGIFPSTYLVSATRPQLIFRLTTSIHIAIDSYTVTSSILYGMNALLEDCNRHRNDPIIPVAGIKIVPRNVAIYVKPASAISVTNSVAAAIYRGIWEMTAFHGAYSFNVDVYLGRISPTTYRGGASIYAKLESENGTSIMTEAD